MARHETYQQYRDGTDKVRGMFASNARQAEDYYRRYVGFVIDHLPRRPGRVLDVGCGSAWSTWLFRQAGHDAYGTDLHSRRAEALLQDPELPYATAQAGRLPFADATFDAVGMYQVLEHVFEPRQVLQECFRVLRPGGRLAVVGPHLLSAGLALSKSLTATGTALLWGGRRDRRGPETPRHPYGNTLSEHYRALGHDVRQTLSKLGSQRPVQFLMREPDPRPPFHADNDACYYCNPMDLVLWARQTPGVRAVRWWAPDRRADRLFWPVAGGTWVVLEKRGAVPAAHE